MKKVLMLINFILLFSLASCDQVEDLAGDVPSVDTSVIDGLSDYNTEDLREKLGSVSGKEVAEAEVLDINFSVVPFDSTDVIVSTTTSASDGDLPTGSSSVSKCEVTGIDIDSSISYDEAKIVVNQVAGPCLVGSSDKNVILLKGRVTGSTDDGENLICIILKKDGAVVGRSKLLLVNTTFASPQWRFELRWNGTGDLDSWLVQSDDTSNYIYWSSTTSTDTGFAGVLDADNTTAYGPENIKMTDSAGTSLKYYVNPYEVAGYTATEFTVVIYKDGEVYEKTTRSLSGASDNSGSSDGSGMFYIGEYTY
jgi:hypothetical protein